MVKKIAQLRFPGTEITYKDDHDTWGTNLFDKIGSSDSIKKIMNLGIYAIPGTKFKINQESTTTEKELQINGLGVFQMDVSEHPITKLYLHQSNYKLIEGPEALGHYIIIDVVYEEVSR